MSKNKERQKTEIKAEGLTFERPKKTAKPRDRSWDKEHNYQVASYRINQKVKQEIKDMSNKLKVSPGDLVEFLLFYGLEAYKRGDLKIEREPKEYDIKAG